VLEQNERADENVFSIPGDAHLEATSTWPIPATRTGSGRVSHTKEVHLSMRISHRVSKRTLLLTVSGLAVLSMVTAALAAFHIGVTHASTGSQSLPTAGVTFTSTPASANIVAHYVVSPTGSGHGGAAAATAESPLAAKWPKGNGPASVVSNSSGVSGGGNGSAATNTATPGTTSSFIGQQGSNITCPYFATGCNPPDMALAASPQFVFQGVNMQFEVLDPQGNV